MYQIGRNSGIVLSFLNYFFTVLFYVFCRKRSVQCISVIEKQITRRGWNRWYVQSQYHSIFFHNQTFLRNSWRIFYHINRFCASKHSYWICWFFKKNIIKYVQYNTHIYMPLETRIILPVFKHVFDYLVKLPCLSYLSFWRDLLYIYWSFLCTRCLGGVIAGAIIGVLAVAGLSGLLAFFLYRRWKKNKEERKVEPEENGGENPVSQKPPVSTSLN